MTKKKMPINSCFCDCSNFKEAQNLGDPDICTVNNRIVYCDEDYKDGTNIPVWCPNPNSVKVIEKCSECNRQCGFKGYCWELHRIVNLEYIDKDCPFEDAVKDSREFGFCFK